MIAEESEEALHQSSGVRGAGLGAADETSEGATGTPAEDDGGKERVENGAAS